MRFVRPRITILTEASILASGVIFPNMLKGFAKVLKRAYGWSDADLDQLEADLSEYSKHLHLRNRILLWYTTGLRC